MILSISKIKELLSRRYSTIEFLEVKEKTTGRYKDKDIILFEYTNAAGELVVLKFFSLQKLEETEKQQEKQDLLTEYQTIRLFGAHPNIVRVYDANELHHNGTLIGFYITMEKFQWTLSQILDQIKQFREVHVEEFLRQMDDVLQTAHYKLPEPVVHSDIKPANIGVRETAAGYEYALMDFDISVALEHAGEDTASFTLSNKATMRGLSPAYAPPEQVMAYLHKTGSISNRVDVYAAGAIAMQMLTGIPPQKDEQKVYYTLPFDALSSPEWKTRFEALCNPNPKQRAKRIADEEFELESKKTFQEKPDSLTGNYNTASNNTVRVSSRTIENFERTRKVSKKNTRRLIISNKNSIKGTLLIDGEVCYSVGNQKEMRVKIPDRDVTILFSGSDWRPWINSKSNRVRINKSRKEPAINLRHKKNIGFIFMSLILYFITMIWTIPVLDNYINANDLQPSGTMDTILLFGVITIIPVLPVIFSMMLTPPRKYKLSYII